MASPFGPTTETTVLEPDAGERAQTAAELLASVIDDNTMAAMAAQARSSGLALMGEGGLMQQMFKRFLEASLQGASLLAQSLGDPEPLQREGRRLLGWLQALDETTRRNNPAAAAP